MLFYDPEELLSFVFSVELVVLDYVELPASGMLVLGGMLVLEIFEIAVMNYLLNISHTLYLNQIIHVNDKVT